MNINTFWQLIEEAWGAAPTWNDKRKQALQNKDYELLQQLDGALAGPVLETYQQQLYRLSKEELTAFIHHLEERIYHIDRQEIHQYTDGSDDGFLYCRCFIVGMGEDYYNKIDQDPSQASFDLEAESFGFEAYQVYEDRFGEEFDRYQFHSMETCSQEESWG